MTNERTSPEALRLLGILDSLRKAAKALDEAGAVLEDEYPIEGNDALRIGIAADAVRRSLEGVGRSLPGGLNATLNWAHFSVRDVG